MIFIEERVTFSAHIYDKQDSNFNHTWVKLVVVLLYEQSSDIIPIIMSHNEHCTPLCYDGLRGQSLIISPAYWTLVITFSRQKWNEWGFRPPLCTYKLKLGQENLFMMVRWMRWRCPPETGFEIRTMAVWDRARYLLVTEAPHNIEFLRLSREETFCFFETWRPEWGSNPRSPTFQADSFNHCTR